MAIDDSALDSAQIHTPLSSQGRGGDIGPGSPGFWLAGMILRKSRSHLSMNTSENDVQGGIYFFRINMDKLKGKSMGFYDLSLC